MKPIDFGYDEGCDVYKMIRTQSLSKVLEFAAHGLPPESGVREKTEEYAPTLRCPTAEAR